MRRVIPAELHPIVESSPNPPRAADDGCAAGGERSGPAEGRRMPATLGPLCGQS